MKYLLIALSTMVMCGVADAQKAADRAIVIGPWQIEASFTEERKFDRCIMSRSIEDGIETRFMRDESGLSLVMTSPRWELDKGKTYPVEFTAGSTTWKADVAATSEAVRVSLADKRFNEALKNADLLEVRAAGSTIKVPLDKSAAALSRLERCYDVNSKAVETNPFVAPKP